MEVFFVLVAHLLATLVKLMKPGGARSVRAESLLLKHQLPVRNRGRKRTPRPATLALTTTLCFCIIAWRAKLRALDIEEIKSVPYTPISHPFVERLIGTVRRELLDHMFFWSQTDLQRKLDYFKSYYNNARVHSSLQTKTPTEKSIPILSTFADFKNFRWQLHCKGLFETPIAA